MGIAPPPPAAAPAPTVVAPSNTVYVDGGADPGGDGSLTSPFDTITAAVAAAVAGDTILIYPGDYAEVADLTLPNRVSLIGLGGDVPSPETTIGGLGFDGIVLGDDCLVENVTVGGDNAPAFTFSGSRSIVRNCTAYEDQASFNGQLPACAHFTAAGGGENVIDGLRIAGTHSIGVLSEAGNTAPDYVSGIRFVNAVDGTAPPADITAAGIEIRANSRLHVSDVVFDSPVVFGAETLFVSATSARCDATGIRCGDAVPPIHVLGQLNGSDIVCPQAAGNALDIDGASAFVQLAGFFAIGADKIVATNGADHNNFDIGPSFSSFGTVTSGTSTATVSFGQAMDGKPVSAVLAEAEAGVRVDSAVWNGSGGVVVTLSGNTTANRKVFVTVHPHGYGA